MCIRDRFGDMCAAAQQFAEVADQAAHIGAGPAFDVQSQRRRRAILELAIEQVGRIQQVEGMHLSLIHI